MRPPRYIADRRNHKLSHLQTCPTTWDWCSGWSVPAGVSLLLFGERGDELAAEGRDVRYHAAPDQVSLAEGRLVHPGCPSVLQVILYSQGARSVDALHYPGRDRDEPAVADDADGLAALVHLSDETRDLRVAPELVRSPAAGDDDPVELRSIYVLCRSVRPGLEEVLAGDRLEAGTDGDHLRLLLPQPHDRHPVLEVLEPFGHQHDYLLPAKPHPFSFRSSFKSLFTASLASSPPSSRARVSSGTASAPLPERRRLSAASRCEW